MSWTIFFNSSMFIYTWVPIVYIDNYYYAYSCYYLKLLVKWSLSLLIITNLKYYFHPNTATEPHTRIIERCLQLYVSIPPWFSVQLGFAKFLSKIKEKILYSASIMDTALPQKFPFILDRIEFSEGQLHRKSGLHVLDIVVLGQYWYETDTLFDCCLFLYFYILYKVIQTFLNRCCSMFQYILYKRVE